MKAITFDESSKTLILKVFGKDVDEQGFIVESLSGIRVLSPDGDEVHIDDFAGIKKGSEIFITKDLPSLLEYANESEK